TVHAIDFCTFGNSKPFRVKIRNTLNDISTYFYIKKADASRVYGLELEDIISPHRINFLIYKDTLIEEHIAGIPGDVFIHDELSGANERDKTQIAKQFVKFNERCTLRLLGDMRSYNYVVVPTHDFDRVTYTLRAIDFDQQSYEGNLKVYRPQFFKENFQMVKLVMNRIADSSIEQYRREERSQVAKRLIAEKKRYMALIRCMTKDHISSYENVKEMRGHLVEFSKEMRFKRDKTKGKILKTTLEFVQPNYLDVTTKEMFEF